MIEKCMMIWQEPNNKGFPFHDFFLFSHVGRYMGQDVTLECQTEAYPKVKSMIDTLLLFSSLFLSRTN